MTPSLRLVAVVTIGVFAVACAPAASSPAPSSPVPPSSAPASTPETSPSASASSSTDGCPVPERTGALPSNTLIGMAADKIGARDRMTFSFGDPVGFPSELVGRLRAVAPPFTHASTGDPVDVVGDRFLEIVFSGLVISDGEGNPTFQGQRDARYGLPAIKHAVIFEEFEGQVGVILGFTGDGCVALVGYPGAGTISLEIPHPEG
jgi:hypothetical protein